VGDGPERVALEALARELSLGPLVAFRGYVPYGEELLRWYRRAHILVVPSLTEGIPQVVIEAMANSVAIVATRVGGIPSLVEDGETGLLVAAGSAEDLAAALRRMVVEPGLRCRLVERAREAVSRFTREAQLDAIVRVMQEWGRQPLAS
jgi:glycosyltransferase involved in cell wall biosynthesis